MSTGKPTVVTPLALRHQCRQREAAHDNKRRIAPSACPGFQNRASPKLHITCNIKERTVELGRY